MKNLLRVATAMTALALSTPALAQQATAASKTDGKFGLGVGLTSSRTTDVPDSGMMFYVPLNLAPNFRIEPFIGWARGDTDAVGKTSDFTLGIGAFLVQPVAAQVQLYAGGRLGSRWESSKAPPPGDLKRERRDTLLAVAAGGEYLPVPRVALGAELQLGYLSVGDTKVTTGGITVEGGGGSGSFTQGTLFARFYLF